ncbi:MAG: winged helix-turn-helix domain-containing protein [Spirochaetes bacterium]|jgi:DNA-binding Lrp family transcriptional regulator|nr:winged helix-turn-helix domain-containing protein [Spirochaetota bacterium]
MKLDIYSNLDDTDKDILKHKIQFPSISNTDLCTRVGISRTTLIARLKKESVRAAICESQKEAIEILIDLQTKAARTLGTLLKSGDETIQLAVAREILKSVNPDTLDLKLRKEDPDETMKRVYDKINAVPEKDNEFAQ